MTCVICRTGETTSGHATVTLTRGDTTVIVKSVPAEICDNCGEYYLSEDVARRVRERAEQAVRNGAEVEIARYAA